MRKQIRIVVTAAVLSAAMVLPTGCGSSSSGPSADTAVSEESPASGTTKAATEAGTAESTGSDGDSADVSAEDSDGTLLDDSASRTKLDDSMDRSGSGTGTQNVIDEDAIRKAQENASSAMAAVAQAAFNTTNTQRQQNGLAALTWSNDLVSAAAVRAQECAQSYSHTRPNGQDWWTVNPDLMFGENLAWNYTSADSVVAAWMNSPAHKANILNSGYVTIGISVYQTPAGDWYWAQEFGY